MPSFGPVKLCEMRLYRFVLFEHKVYVGIRCVVVYTTCVAFVEVVLDLCILSDRLSCMLLLNKHQRNWRNNKHTV